MYSFLFFSPFSFSESISLFFFLSYYKSSDKSFDNYEPLIKNIVPSLSNSVSSILIYTFLYFVVLLLFFKNSVNSYFNYALASFKNKYSKILQYSSLLSNLFGITLHSLSAISGT